MNKSTEDTSEKGTEWTNAPSSEASLCYIYKCGVFTDVTLHAKKEDVLTCFSAHKIVLALRSPVLASMLFPKSGNSNAITLDGVTPCGLGILLWYLYSDMLECDLPELFESFEAAHKFEICSFYDVCVQRILEISDISSSNVCSILKVANCAKSDNLRKMCIRIIEKEPENVIRAKDFLSIDKDTMLIILKRKHSMCPKDILKTILRWMKHNGVRDNCILSNIDFSAFKIDEFFSTIIQEYPKIFSRKVLFQILSNLVQPGSSELPKWCKFIKKKPTVQNMTLYQGMEFIKENAMQVITDCSCKFSQFSFYGQDEFNLEILFKVISSDKSFKLTMLELAFGSNYVPYNNLSIDIFCNTVRGKKMRRVEYSLIPCLRHYYLLLSSDTMSKIGFNFNLFLKIHAVELRSWMGDSPVSNHQFRVASVPASNSNKIVPTQCTKHFRTVNIKPFDDWPIFLDSENGLKYFIISSLFIDSEKNIDKYAKYLYP